MEIEPFRAVIAVVVMKVSGRPNCLQKLTKNFGMVPLAPIINSMTDIDSS